MKNKMLFYLGLLFLLIFSGLVGCYSVPVTGRSSLDLVSDKAMEQISKEKFIEMKSIYQISHDYRHNDRVQRVGNRIAEVTQWDILNPEWEFVVFQNDDMLNAFAMAGGKVGIYTGLLNFIESDDELAIVLGHEIAHVAAKHVHERYSHEMVKQGLGAGIGVAMGGIAQTGVAAAYGLGGLGFNRKMEGEADSIGLMYAAKAGYDPRVAIDFWERMTEVEEDRAKPPELLSTHPSHGVRLANLHAAMPEAVERFERVKSGGPAEDIIIIE